ncbi:MAG: hypothetical protein KY458_04515 [Actinobacteria bacterium]|nr:hypothetical protein [Actinomycetota bacterium]
MALPDVSTSLQCRGRDHHLRWEAGALVADDHADREAEEALRALGGELPACLRLQRLWARYADDVALVTLGRRPGEAGLGLAPAAVAPMVDVLGRASGNRLWRRGSAQADAATDGRRGDLLSLLSLPLPFIDRLVLGVFAHAARSWHHEGFRSAHGLRLGAAWSSRAQPALRRLGERLHAPVAVACTPAAPAQPTSVRAELSGGVLVVSAELSPWWVPTVWGAGISEPQGRFILRVVASGGGGLAVEEGEWEPTGSRSWNLVARPAHLRRDDEGLFRVDERPRPGSW